MANVTLVEVALSALELILMLVLAGDVVSASPSVFVPGTCIRAILKLRLLVCVPMEKLSDSP